MNRPKDPNRIGIGNKNLPSPYDSYPTRDRESEYGKLDDAALMACVESLERFKLSDLGPIGRTFHRLDLSAARAEARRRKLIQ